MNGDVWVIKTDADGNLMWDRMYGGDANDYGYTIEQTRDGGLIVGGYTQSFGTGLTSAWLLRFAPITTSIEFETPGVTPGIELHPNYPNPYSSSTRIE